MSETNSTVTPEVWYRDGHLYTDEARTVPFIPGPQGPLEVRRLSLHVFIKDGKRYWDEACTLAVTVTPAHL